MCGMHDQDLEKIVDGLHWNHSSETQESAISAIQKLDDSVLPAIFGMTAKPQWQNYVEAVRRIGFPRNRDMLPSLLILLQDLNWPGAEQALQILMQSERSVLLPLLAGAIRQAYADHDFEWLGGLRLLVQRCNLNESDFADSRLFQWLEAAAW